MLTEGLLRQAIEAIREGSDPKDLLSENLIETVGEENFENAILNVIEDIWLPLGDKAYIRLGYHEAITKLNRFLYPERHKSKEEILEFNIKDYYF
jgi:hypothetical protein